MSGSRASRSSTVPPSGVPENGFRGATGFACDSHVDSQVLSEMGDDLVREPIKLGLDGLELQHEQFDTGVKKAWIRSVTCS